MTNVITLYAGMRDELDIFIDSLLDMRATVSRTLEELKVDIPVRIDASASIKAGQIYANRLEPTLDTYVCMADSDNVVWRFRGRELQLDTIVDFENFLYDMSLTLQPVAQTEKLNETWR